MYSGAIKSLVICTFGAIVIAGCSSAPPASSSQSFASSQTHAQRGQIAAVESPAAVGQSMGATSSGSSGGTGASGGQEIITVNYADGSEGRYLITQQSAPLKVGEPIAVVRHGDTFTIFAQ